MEISSFELIYKPQSPVGPADTVLQGYFLNITNLENEELFYRLDFVTSSISDPDRSLFNNTAAIIDTPNQNNQPANLVGALTSSSFRLSPNITVPPDGTAKVAVLPSDPFPMPTSPANFEARGYVTIRLPARLVFDPPFIRFEPQLNRPARVLLTPQNRAAYLDENNDINDQTQASLPTGTGSAIVEVVPERGFFVPLAQGMADRLTSVDLSTLPDLTEENLAMMLAAVSASDVDLKKFNSELKKAGIGIALEKRKV
ncbi:MAG: hypothetical protein AAGA21_09385 [Pseudomonadota bacterium]